MRLINVHSLILEEFFGNRIPTYAILSHTWGDEEVAFHDWRDEDRRATKKGFQKIRKTCLQAQKDGYDWVWVDTNCINKESSADLSEAINSMFAWYGRSAVCYVYLEDYQHTHGDDLRGFVSSRWFTRGWTLQELLAPTEVQFFDNSWTYFGDKITLCQQIMAATSIPEIDLRNDRKGGLRQASVSMRMSWAASRSTTREEDVAYCLLGIFGIHMPLLYGEGEQAFIRLQEEIIKHNNDHTIFCWSRPLDSTIRYSNGFLAMHPSWFRGRGNYLPTTPIVEGLPPDFQVTNSGLRITLPMLVPVLSDFLVVLEFAVLNVAEERERGRVLICLCLEKPVSGTLVFSRSQQFPEPIIRMPQSWEAWTQTHSVIYLAHTRTSVLSPNHYGQSASQWRPASIQHQPFAILPFYSRRQLDHSEMRLSRVLEPSDAHRPFLFLQPTNKHHIWEAQLWVEKYNGFAVTVEFKVHIYEDAEMWKTTVNLRWNSGVSEVKAYQLTTIFEFPLVTAFGTTLVCPVYVPLENVSKSIEGEESLIA